MKQLVWPVRSPTLIELSIVQQACSESSTKQSHAKHDTHVLVLFFIVLPGFSPFLNTDGFWNTVHLSGLSLRRRSDPIRSGSARLNSAPHGRTHASSSPRKDPSQSPGADRRRTKPNEGSLPSEPEGRDSSFERRKSTKKALGRDTR